MKIQYRPEIDGLRALAVLSVVFYHAKLVVNGIQPFSGGYIGVDVFFVISGYLITSILLKGLKQGNFSFAEFYERRARRILPALFAILITIMPFALLLLIPWQVTDFAKSTVATLVFVSNIFFWKQSGYFAQDAAGMPLLHTWSLAIEEQFYILFPLVLFLIYKYAPRFLLPLFLITIVISIYLAQDVTPVQPESSFFLLPTRLWELLCGAVLARLEFEHVRKKHNTLASAMTALGLGMVGYAVFFFSENTLHPGYFTMLPVAGTMLIIWFGRSGEFFTGFLSRRPLVYIGLVSYSFYLWHFPMFAFMQALDLTITNIQAIILILIAFSLSVISYHFIEQPFRKKTISLRQLGSYCSASVLILVTCSTVALISDGGLGRYQREDLELVNTSPKNHGQYVLARFNRLVNRPFENNDKTRVLIVGDSHGQDLVNALYEAGLDTKIQLSTFIISRRCGNLYIKDDLSDRIEENYRTFCDRQPGYDDPVLQELIKQADIIWLASSWVLWQAELLPESLTNISRLTEASLLVLGRKDFGTIKPFLLIDVPLEDRPNKRIMVSKSHLETNDYMKNTLEPEIFIDLQELLCDGLPSCPLFNDEMKLISYDGNHLTRIGAMLLGNKLREHEHVLNSLSKK